MPRASTVSIRGWSSAELVAIAKLIEKGPFTTIDWKGEASDFDTEWFRATEWLKKYKKAEPDFYEAIFETTRNARDAGEIFADIAWSDYKKSLRR
jgi:hypothetical protein